MNSKFFPRDWSTGNQSSLVETVCNSYNPRTKNTCNYHFYKWGLIKINTSIQSYNIYTTGNVLMSKHTEICLSPSLAFPFPQPHF